MPEQDLLSLIRSCLDSEEYEDTKDVCDEVNIASRDHLFVGPLLLHRLCALPSLAILRLGQLITYLFIVLRLRDSRRLGSCP